MNLVPGPVPLLRLQAIAAIAIIVGLIGCIIGWIVSPNEFFLAYLFAHFFFLSLSLGAMALLMIHHLTAGTWGYAVRRFLESAVANLPLLALLFLPVFFGVPALYPWKHPALVASNEALQKQQFYLNTSGFVFRSVIVFAVWMIMGRLLLRWSAEQDGTVSVEPTRKLRKLSGPGLVLYPLAMTFASVDWLMSLEAQWSSTIFPVLICIGQILAALSLVILLLSLTAKSSPLAPIASEETFHKIGNLLLAFTMMWAYLAFAQLLVIWSGNLPREISWYLHRTAGGWRWVACFIALFQFFIPFFFLLMRPVKKQRGRLAPVAACILVAQTLTIWWTIAPSIHSTGFYLSWLTVAAFSAVGGLWFALFVRTFSRRPLIPLNDPRFALTVPA